MSNYYQSLTNEQLDQELFQLEQQVSEFRSMNLALDMARGKPNSDQVNLSRPLVDVLSSSVDFIDKGVDAANYGCPEGLPSARQLAAELLNVNPNNVLVEDSSSLHIMYDTIENAFTRGIGGSEPWYKQGTIKFLCPSPGYDRHFALTASFGIQNVAVELTKDGPNMDEVCRLVETDSSVKGIWCVPKYANPTGITYSDEVVRRFARLKPAAPDFRIYWDNAYCVHDLEEPADELLNIFDALEQAGTTNLVYEFASTSKITIPGAGMSWVAASDEDIAQLATAFSFHRVCPNKMVQLAHVRFLQDAQHVAEHMKKHAALVGPRFNLVFSKLEKSLSALDIARWTHPKGGYFVSFDGPEGSAKAIVALAAQLGVKLTSAGATWPYGKDPRDTNIRIAPTFPSMEELDQALDVFIVCVKYIAARLEKQHRQS
ncbi:aminotransferase class I/II-fold pyridoxal phosphate-dependent enzyme [Atopobium fossor]|uniref:aminotransferase class I/II-fold pyridoxal phosphate-dependent enzyme n=1 Tax=Atopobium fossor TaxID=39487 RepID=UPI000407FC78|nr:aminotransferase class I/II-fold pyridoxal phosphate-dependent enzyme [Atopobium fossor]